MNRWTLFLILAIIVATGAFAWLFLTRHPDPADDLADLQDKNLTTVDRDSVMPLKRKAQGTVDETNSHSPKRDTFPIDLPSTEKQLHHYIQQHAGSLIPWLAKDEWIRRFVMDINILADGNLPGHYRLIARKIAPFKAMKNRPEDSTFLASPDNEKRLTPLVKGIQSINASTWIQLYRQNASVFESAFRELGTGGSFEQRLREILQRLATSRPPHDTLLVRPSVHYKYQDQAQEKEASPLDKALWRLGEENMASIRRYATELLKALDSNQA